MGGLFEQFNSLLLPPDSFLKGGRDEKEEGKEEGTGGRREGRRVPYTGDAHHGGEVEGAVGALSDLGVGLVTVHTGGGPAMLEAAARGAAGTATTARRSRVWGTAACRGAPLI